MILNFSRSAPFHMKTTVSLKYHVNDCLWKPFLDFNAPQTPSNLDLLTILVTLRLFTLFEPKIRTIKLQESAKNCFT